MVEFFIDDEAPKRIYFDECKSVVTKNVWKSIQLIEDQDELLNWKNEIDEKRNT